MSRFYSCVLCSLIASFGAHAQEIRLNLKPSMVVNEADVGEPAGLVDEQDKIVGPPSGKPDSIWKINSRNNKQYPFSAHLDLGQEKNLSKLWLFDTHDQGDVAISCGKPGEWKKLTTYNCGKYMEWVSIPLDVRSRYIQLTRMSPGAQFTEIAIYEYSQEAWEATLARKAAEAKAEVERQAAVDKAMDEMKKRPLIDLGEPFGKAYLVDEIDCGSQALEHLFTEDPPGVSKVETILGRPCRFLQKTKGEGAYFSYRIGQMKLLQPGATYVLSVEYPEDTSRSLIVRNSGNETSRGFHTGRTFGDALHPKYVNNHNESLNTPLSGKYEAWNQLFFLHDRFPDREFLREDKERPLTPEDGFTVTIAQFSERNIPASAGAAVSRIRLFAVPDPEALNERPNLPKGLPHRHLFWREEMADGVVGSVKNQKRGITNPVDFFKFKARTASFLGMNTYSKDLLEFGASQHWDPRDGGGNKWVHFNNEHKHLWGEIVELMGKQGFNILPYYEYSGSRGDNSLGYQRRCKPLTRDDAYTHISWIEKANADITDPDTCEDFKKMLDLTVVRHRNKANFIGAWLRQRAQLPMSFADATRERFAEEMKTGRAISREDLIGDKELLEKYYKWWFSKRRQFLEAMRDHLRTNGIENATMFFTSSMAESGAGFPSWDKRIVTDDPGYWQPILNQPQHILDQRKITPAPLQAVTRNDMYLEALLAPPLTWGKWEVHHADPPADPQRGPKTEGVLFTHAFNRAYTVASSKTFDSFRGPSGMAIVRHYTLNEDMMFDKNDKPKLGYFVADIERAGPYCMLAEAWAMAHGNPTHIGYLAGNNFSRGFPKYVRRFNSAFLSLPALPSTIVEDACSDEKIVVREIKTEGKGTWFALVNTGLDSRTVDIKLAITGKVTDAVSQKPIMGTNRSFKASFYPCELKAWRAE